MENEDQDDAVIALLVLAAGLLVAAVVAVAVGVG